MVGDKHLITIELHLVFLQFELVFYLREIQHTGEVEGVVHIQVNLEQRIFERHRVELMVEFLVVFVGQCRGLLFPYRIGIIDDTGHFHLFFLVFAFGFLPFFLHTAADGNGQESAVFVQHAHNTVFFQKFCGVVGNVQNDFCATVCLVYLLHFELGRAVAGPVHSGHIVLVRLGFDFHQRRHHEGRVETQSEVADDVGCVGAFVFLYKLLSAGESNLVDVFLHFLLGHTDTMVDHAEGFSLFIHLHVDGHIAQFYIGFAEAHQGFHFLRSIYSVGNQFSKEYFLV